MISRVFCLLLSEIDLSYLFLLLYIIIHSSYSIISGFGAGNICPHVHNIQRMLFNFISSTGIYDAHFKSMYPVVVSPYSKLDFARSQTKSATSKSLTLLQGR